MWRARPPEPQQILLLRAARERFDLRPLVVHVNYLTNLASLDPVIRSKSIESFRGELVRTAAIGAEYLVLHSGSYRGSTREEGIAAFALGLRDVEGAAQRRARVAGGGLDPHVVVGTVGEQAGVGRFREGEGSRGTRDQGSGIRDQGSGFKN